MRGEYRVKNEALRELVGEAEALARRLGSASRYTAVRREHNELADRLVNEALDAAALKAGGYTCAARADVAQLARASACHAEGRGFESHHPLLESPAQAGFFFPAVSRWESYNRESVQVDNGDEPQRSPEIGSARARRGARSTRDRIDQDLVSTSTGSRGCTRPKPTAHCQAFSEPLALLLLVGERRRIGRRTPSRLRSRQLWWRSGGSRLCSGRRLRPRGHRRRTACSSSSATDRPRWDPGLQSLPQPLHLLGRSRFSHHRKHWRSSRVAHFLPQVRRAG